MDRRKFLQCTLPSTVAFPFILNSMKVRAFSPTMMDQSLACSTLRGKPLVTAPTYSCASTFKGIGEVGNLTGVVQKRKRQWHMVTLDRKYDNPVVIMGPASSHGMQPLTIRVKNITGNSFKWQVDEWNYLDGGHVGIDISYMVVETGVHTLSNGKQLIAGITDNIINHRWKNIVFPNAFASKPLVLTQCCSYRGSSAVVSRVKHVSSTSFGLKLQEEEGANGSHVKESTSWVAMDPSTFDDWLKGEGGLTSTKVTHQNHRINFSRPYSETPVFFASVQTFHGADPINIHYKRLESDRAVIRLEEEKSKDLEVGHWNREQVGYLIFDEPGQLMGATSPPYDPVASSTFKVSCGESEPSLPEGRLSFNCYPNPFVNKVSIEFHHTPSKKVRVELRDVLGNLIKASKIVSSKKVYTLRTGSLPVGNYFIRVLSGNRVSTYGLTKKPEGVDLAFSN